MLFFLRLCIYGYVSCRCAVFTQEVPLRKSLINYILSGKVGNVNQRVRYEGVLLLYSDI